MKSDGDQAKSCITLSRLIKKWGNGPLCLLTSCPGEHAALSSGCTDHGNNFLIFPNETKQENKIFRIEKEKKTPTKQK